MKGRAILSLVLFHFPHLFFIPNIIAFTTPYRRTTPPNNQYRNINGRFSVKARNTNDAENTHDNLSTSRRSAVHTLFNIGTITPTISSLLLRPSPSSAATTTKTPLTLHSTWISTAGLRSDLPSAPSQFVSFDASAYKAMKNDITRTPAFERAIKDRLDTLPNGPSSATVLDLGTGPYALFAVAAAAMGAGKVYAIEASPEAAALAREVVKSRGYEDVVTILEGFSTAIPSLPNGDKADVVVAEIIGSVASEEGCVATAVDARRFLKRPEESASWIPARVQTYAAPASYTLHNLFGPPGFDWKKLGDEPVRFDCRDEGLQLLADPVLVEDISFADLEAAAGKDASDVLEKDVTFRVSDDRVKQNTLAFYQEYKNGGLPAGEAAGRAKDTARTVSGIALWPRLILREGNGSGGGDNNAGSLLPIAVDSRGYRDGEHRRSHWQTVLPIGAERPIGGLMPGDRIEASFRFDRPTGKVDVPPSYVINGKVYATGSSSEYDDDDDE